MSEKASRIGVAGVVLIVGTGCHLFSAPPAPPEAPDIIIADFEQIDFVGFAAAGAFGEGPESGSRPGQDRVTGFSGRGYASSFSTDGPAAVGEMVSAGFTLARPYLTFLIGGRYDPERLAVRLVVDGKPVRVASGTTGATFPADHLAPVSWDVRPWRGREAMLQIVDDSHDPGAHLLVDDFVMSTRPAARRNLDDRWRADAELEVARAAGRATQDPLRPVYHLMPAGHLLAGVSGPVWHRGRYHVFFSHNPFGDDWGHVHWGHVSSADLVHWQRAPVALAPSLDDGEFHCLAGAAITMANDALLLAYTSAGVRGLEQWMAVSTDPDANVFRRAEHNPFLTQAAHQARHKDLSVDDWRDPFLFKEGGATYLLLGGHPHGGQGAVFLYRSTDLRSWTYLGTPLSGTDANWSNPLLFRLGDRWVFIYNPGGPVRYQTGTLDLQEIKFTPDRQGILDLGRGPAAKDGHLHAPNVLGDGHDRHILFGAVRGFPAGRGWNGAMTVPRVLSLDGDGALVQAPAPELRGLRDAGLDLGVQPLKERAFRIDGFSADAFELSVHLDLGDARRSGLKLRQSRDRGRAVIVAFDGQNLLVEEQLIKIDRPGRTIDLQIFIDRSMMEIFVNGGRQVVTRTLRARPDEQGVELFAAGGESRFENLRLFRMQSPWQDSAQEVQP